MAKRLPIMAVLLLAGCSMAPPYHSPVAPTAPAAFKEAGPWAEAMPAELAPKGQWWRLYGDEVLSGLEERIESSNPTLSGALARYDNARAYLRQTHAALLPQVGIGATITDNRQSDNRPTRGGGGGPDLYPADTLGGTLSYEFDLWGRVRNSVAASRANAQASADDLAAIRLSLEAQLATAYVGLRGLDAQAALLQSTVAAYTEADALTRRRFAGGIASGMEIAQSGTQLAEARAQLEEVRAARALTEHAIASLIGETASSFTLAPVQTELAIPEIPAGVPSTLLQRRPDVAAAERRVAAANSRIGVAKAAFFPTIGLGGNGGFQNTGIPGLMTAPNIFWSIGPSAVLPLFDGGRRKAVVAQARAQWSQATAAYREDVLRAFQEVEDGLAQLHHLGDEAGAEAQAVKMASDAETIAMNRYQKGAVTYLDVVTAQATALRTRRTALDLNTRRLSASIQLIRALGGGWRIAEGRNMPKPPESKGEF